MKVETFIKSKFTLFIALHVILNSKSNSKWGVIWAANESHFKVLSCLYFLHGLLIYYQNNEIPLSKGTIQLRICRYIVQVPRERPPSSPITVPMSKMIYQNLGCHQTILQLQPRELRTEQQYTPKGNHETYDINVYTLNDPLSTYFAQHKRYKGSQFSFQQQTSYPRSSKKFSFVLLERCSVRSMWIPKNIALKKLKRSPNWKEQIW